ncbi:MAG: insulinase family protein [Firmicutes bacterium]|nr:insulinase family protein [Bacillota bacterium]
MLKEENAERLCSFNNIEVYYIPVRKFKTITISFFFIDTLSKDTVSKNALVPAVLRRGCKSYPTMSDISLRLEELYGGSFDCGVAKKGEYHVIYFHTECIAEKYVADMKDFFKKPFELIVDIITSPVIENGIFKREYVVQEKESLKRLIERRVNDKVQYAIERCFEEMCKDEPFGIYDYGDISGLKEVSESSLYEHYKNIIDNYPLKVFVTGDVPIEKLEWIKQNLLKIRHNGEKDNNNNNKYNGEYFLAESNKVEEVKQVTEHMAVNQAKLSLGFRTNVLPTEKDYYPLIVFDSILGGGVYSKLFQKVREEAGLAYYIFSQLEKFKGLLLITCGIEIKDRNRAVDIILKQIDSIKSGNITQYEHESAIKSIETGIGFLKDNQLKITDYYFSQILATTNDNFQTLADKIKRVSIEDVINVSKKIELDTIYFLASNGQ